MTLSINLVSARVQPQQFNLVVNGLQGDGGRKRAREVVFMTKKGCPMATEMPLITMQRR